MNNDFLVAVVLGAGALAALGAALPHVLPPASEKVSASVLSARSTGDEHAGRDVEAEQASEDEEKRRKQQAWDAETGRIESYRRARAERDRRDADEQREYERQRAEKHQQQEYEEYREAQADASRRAHDERLEAYDRRTQAEADQRYEMNLRRNARQPKHYPTYGVPERKVSGR